MELNEIEKRLLGLRVELHEFIMFMEMSCRQIKSDFEIDEKKLINQFINFFEKNYDKFNDNQMMFQFIKKHIPSKNDAFLTYYKNFRKNLSEIRGEHL